MSQLRISGDQRLEPSDFAKIDVAQIYDTLGQEYEDYILDDAGRLRCLQWASENLLAAAYCIDLGCASGKPVVEYLAAKGHQVIGVDLSPGQIELARKNITESNVFFEVADLRTWTPPSERVGKVDCVLSFYVLPHLSFEDYGQVIRNMAAWLRPGGLFVLGVVKHVNGRLKFLGHDVAATSMGLEENRTLVEESGIRVEKAWEEDWESKGPKAGHRKTNQFVLGRKI